MITAVWAPEWEYVGPGVSDTTGPVQTNRSENSVRLLGGAVLNKANLGTWRATRANFQLYGAFRPLGLARACFCPRDGNSWPTEFGPPDGNVDGVCPRTVSRPRVVHR